jgi:hypothetical protein
LTGKVYDEEYRYPPTVRPSQSRCDNRLPRGERESSCRDNSTGKYTGLRCSVTVGPTGQCRAGKRSHTTVTRRIVPRLVYQKDAAFYCTMGVESFRANCPVAPVPVGPGPRGLRYDLRDVDAWIDSLKQSSICTETNVNWLDRVGNDESADKRN